MKQEPFDWDDAKAEANLQKHGVSFEEAASVIWDRLALTYPNPFHSITEDRWLTIGISNMQRYIAVITTQRGETIRIISARKATSYEIKKYEATDE